MPHPEKPTEPTRLERFDQWCDVTHGHAMTPHPKGLFVRYADVEPLIQRAAAPRMAGADETYAFDNGSDDTVTARSNRQPHTWQICRLCVEAGRDAKRKRKHSEPQEPADHADLLKAIEEALPAINSVRMVRREDGNTYEGESDICDLLRRCKDALRSS